MKSGIFRGFVTCISSVSLVLGPAAVSSQSIEEHEAAKAVLGGYFWQIDKMRSAVPDTHFDPGAMAWALGDDPASLFEFVRSEIAYQPYPGLLRYGSGTMMSLAGISCDQAALLG